jgi:IclR-like helix-turn-helix domain-containing protein
MLELSPSQVDQVVRMAAGAGNLSVLLGGLGDVRDDLLARWRTEDGRLSQSLLTGLVLLTLFPADGSYLTNAEIARELSINPSTSHRYISTLVVAGLLERDPNTRRYRLARDSEAKSARGGG